MSDCTPKHLFVDLAPAFEEPPDLLSAPSILHSTVLCGVVRLNQPHVMVRRQAGAPIHGPSQAEPSPQGPLPRQRANAIVHTSRCFILSCAFLPCIQVCAAAYSGVGEVCCSRNRGGGPPIVYGSLYVSMCQKIVVSRRITATLAILDPRLRLIFRYQFRILGSRLRMCTTNCPKMKRAVLLPCLVMEPSRS